VGGDDVHLHVTHLAFRVHFDGIGPSVYVDNTESVGSQQGDGLRHASPAIVVQVPQGCNLERDRNRQGDWEKNLNGS
jgi:hypothetical protein